MASTGEVSPFSVAGRSTSSNRPPASRSAPTRSVSARIRARCWASWSRGSPEVSRKRNPTTATLVGISALPARGPASRARAVRSRIRERRMMAFPGPALAWARHRPSIRLAARRLVHGSRGGGRTIPCDRRCRLPAQGPRPGRHGRARSRQGARPRPPAGRRAAPGRAAGHALRPGPLGRAADLPGHGRRRQGQRHQARDVGREPARRAGLQLQAALGGGARPRLPVARQPRRCPSAAGSASSTAPTTRRSWSPASTSGSWTPRSSRPSSSHRKSGPSAARTSRPTSATSPATAC